MLLSFASASSKPTTTAAPAAAAKPAAAAPAPAAAAAAAAAAAGPRTGGITAPDAKMPRDPAAFSSLPPAAVANLPLVDKVWLEVEGPQRVRLETLLGKKSFNATKALAVRTEGIKQISNSQELPTLGAIKPKLAPAVEAFINSGKSDVDKVFSTYNDLSLLLKGLEREREVLQLDIWGHNDVIQLGLKFYPADKLAATRKNLQETHKKLAANRVVMKETVAVAFSTEVMNDLLNALRITFATTGDGNARELGVQILDDLSLFNVAFNAETELLFRNLVFGDLPHEDSGLLFELVESSVGGSVSVQAVPFASDSKQPPCKSSDIANALPWSAEIDAVADDTLRVISHQLQTPLSTELKKLRLVEAHPQL